jgi:hypothetical protein
MNLDSLRLKLAPHLAACIEVGDCLEWQHTMGVGMTKHVPILKTRIDGKSANVIVPRLLWQLERGEIPAGRIVYRDCSNERCVCLAHLRLGKRGDQLKARKRNGKADHMQSTRAAITLSARARECTLYSLEQARAVRELAAAGVPDILIAGATDVSPAMVSDIRRGRAWAEQQFAASVFTWRPAA